MAAVVLLLVLLELYGTSHVQGIDKYKCVVCVPCALRGPAAGCTSVPSCITWSLARGFLCPPEAPASRLVQSAQQ